MDLDKYLEDCLVGKAYNVRYCPSFNMDKCQLYDMACRNISYCRIKQVIFNLKRIIKEPERSERFVEQCFQELNVEVCNEV